MSVLPRALPLVALATVLLSGPALAQDDTIRQYQLEPGGDAFRLVMKEVPQPVPGEQEVLVRMRAASLNARDRAFLEGQAFRPDLATRSGLIPLGAGAGEVVAIGPGVTRFQTGDRVATTLFKNGVDPRRKRGAAPDAEARAIAAARGGPGDGVLSEMIVSHEDGLVSVPDHLTFEEAATLSNAAATAWDGLFTLGQLQPGDFVLLEGTGGVSTFGLLFSVAAGARPIITSSSDAKLERARELGAFGTVNYVTNPDWEDEVRALTGGVGVAHVLEVGGRETFPKAIRALGYGGHISVIGALTGFPSSMPVPFLGILQASVSGGSPGSREDFEAMNAFISEHQLKPVIDRVFSFEDAAAAYEYYAEQTFMGKIVIRL